MPSHLKALTCGRYPVLHFGPDKGLWPLTSVERLDQWSAALRQRQRYRRISSAMSKWRVKAGSAWRIKPVVIDAFRWTGGPDQEEDPLWISEAIKSGQVFFHERDVETWMGIRLAGRDGTESFLYAKPGDWILRGIEGEIYPLRADVFEATYEAVN